MKFLFYKAANYINKELSIRFPVKKRDDSSYNIASKYNLTYISLFITIKEIDDIKKVNEFDIDNQSVDDNKRMTYIIGGIDGATSSKKMATGERSIPSAYKNEYDDMKKLDTELMKSRFDFFKYLINNESNVIGVNNYLRKMVEGAVNIANDAKQNILSDEYEDVFFNLRKDIDNESDLKKLQIFKILAYSVRYSDVRSPYDDLESSYILHPNFVERSEIIDELNTAFSTDNIVYLCGIRGIGKTEISQKYISVNNYYGVVSLDYSDDLLEKIKEMDIFICKDKQDNLELIKGMDENYLLIIENVTLKLPKEILEFIGSCKCRVLIISSFRPRDERCKIVDVPDLKPEQAAEMMYKYILTPNRLTEEQAENIAKKLNYHSLAVSVYAKAIEQSCLEYDEICQIINESTVSDKISEMVNHKDNEELACKHIKALFDKSLLNMDNECKAVLRVMSLMPYSGIEIKMLQEFTGLKNNNAIYTTLYPMGWLEVYKDSSQTVRIHSIIRDIVLSELKPDVSNCNTLVKSLYYKIGEKLKFSTDGILCRAIYLSTVKKINYDSQPHNMQIFDFLIKGINSLLSYNYNKEAQTVYSIAEKYIDKLEDSDKEDAKNDLKILNYSIQSYDSIEDFLQKNGTEIENVIQYVDKNILKFERNPTLQRGHFFTYIYKLNSFLSQYFDRLYSTKSIPWEYIDNFDYIYEKIYTYLLCMFPGYITAETYDEKGEFHIDTVIPDFEVPDFKEGYLSILYNVAYLRVNYLIFLKLPSAYQACIYANNVFKLHYGEALLRYIKFLKNFYMVCKQLKMPDTTKISEQIKSIYTKYDFQNYVYEEITDIVKEFNLPHSRVDLLTYDESEM